MHSLREEVTGLLLSWSEGDQAALDRLAPLVAKELRLIAARYMASERSDHTLQPTALVNELFIRLVDRRKVQWENRAQFFGFAAQTMRRILVDHARTHRASKRGSGAPKAPLDEAIAVPDGRAVDLVALDEALDDLARIHPIQSRIIELRCFAGLSLAETAVVLEASERSVSRHWTAARAWLFRELRDR